MGEPLAAVRRKEVQRRSVGAFALGRSERQAPVSTRYLVFVLVSVRKKTLDESEAMAMVEDEFFVRAQGGSHFLALGPNLA